jgi:hypothetical protein
MSNSVGNLEPFFSEPLNPIGYIEKGDHVFEYIFYTVPHKGDAVVIGIEAKIGSIRLSIDDFDDIRLESADTRIPVNIPLRDFEQYIVSSGSNTKRFRLKFSFCKFFQQGPFVVDVYQNALKKIKKTMKKVSVATIGSYRVRSLLSISDQLKRQKSTSRLLVKAIKEDDADEFLIRVRPAFGNPIAMANVCKTLTKHKPLKCIQKFHIRHYREIVKALGIAKAEAFLKANPRPASPSGNHREEESDQGPEESDDGESHEAYKKRPRVLDEACKKKRKR